MIDNRVHFVRGDIRVLETDRFRAPACEVQHVAVPEELVRPVHVEYGPRVRLGCHLVGDPGGEVRLDHPRDHVHRRPLRRDDEVDPHGAGELCQPGDRFLHLPRRRDHQVGELVDDDDKVRHFRVRHLFRVLQAPRGEPLVVIDDVADPRRGEPVVTILHLDLHPPQDDDRIPRRGDDLFIDVGRDGQEMVLETAVLRQLDLLRIDDDKFQVGRMKPVEEARQYRVDPDAFSGARRSGDEQVGHFRQVVGERLSGDGLPHRQGEKGAGFTEYAGVDHAPDRHDRAVRVRDLDSDGRLSRDGGHDTDPLRRELERHVVFQAHDPADLHAAGGDELIQRHDRSRSDADALQLDVELRQRRA